MRSPTNPTRHRRSWLLTVIAMLAMTAQLVVSLAPLAEGRSGRSLAAHVESGGAKGHYTHDDASCAACQARSIHGATSRPAFVASTFVVAIAAPESSIGVSRSTDLHTLANPRAPPSVI